jgi:hypothetical protein
LKIRHCIGRLRLVAGFFHVASCPDLLRHIHEDFQRFLLTSGDSTRHERDMAILPDGDRNPGSSTAKIDDAWIDAILTAVAEVAEP